MALELATVSWEGSTASITKITDANVMFDILSGHDVIISGGIDRRTGSADMQFASRQDDLEVRTYDLMCKTVGSVGQTASEIVSLWCNGTEQFTSTFTDGTAAPFDSSPIKNTGIAINTGNKTISVGGYGWTVPYIGRADVIANVRSKWLTMFPMSFIASPTLGFFQV